MLKKILSLAMLLVASVGAWAQAEMMMQPLPLDPNVKSGTLPNGLKYYILHNEEPKNRADFYIAQKVGSSLETPEQLGLAHFLEHMAFNGTKNFPGKAMLEYLQAKGIRFGADINAYTAFDETVYNINNVPCNDVALMDSVLLVLHDWSCDLLLEDDEIEAERGVIHEEWRTRDNAAIRMYTAMLPKIYDEPQYHQMPIGSMDVVMNFKPEVLRDYYHTWYRPDQQGIIIVGDFDAAEMEKKVIALFSPIPMPENAKERTYPTVSDNEKPIFFAFEDPETQYTMATISFKYDKTPFELRNTIAGYWQDECLETVFSMLINNRLQEYQHNADCKYAYAGLRFDDFYVSKTKGAINITVLAKDDLMAAIHDAMAVVARACKTGFTDSELERVNSEIISQVEKAYNERNTTNSEELARGIIRHFVDNNPYMGPEIEFQLVQQLLPNIPVEQYNEIAKNLLTSNNQVIVVQQPKRDGSQLPAEEVTVGVVEEALNAQYEAYVDEVITEPLINKYAKAGKIVKEVNDPVFGTTTYTLSNGVNVVVKTTDFSSDEILMTATALGGKRLFSEQQADNVLMLDDAVNASRLGNFNNQMMRKYLAGKQVNVSYSLNNFTTTVEGKTAVKDLETMLDLTYATFTALSADQDTYNSTVEQLVSILKNNENNPQIIFQRALSNTTYGGNPLMISVPTVAMVTGASYPEMLKMAQSTMQNAADYTFYFVGNVDKETLKPMLCKYIASLPSKKKATAPKYQSNIELAKGNVENFFDQPMQNPITNIYDCYNGTNLAYNLENEICTKLAGQILSNIFTETIREEMGAAYSPYAYTQLHPFMGNWQLIYVIDTNADVKQAVIDRAHLETAKLFTEGAPEEKFQKVKQAALQQYENNVRTNGYWMGNLVNLNRGYDMITGHREILEGLTLEKFNAFMKNMWQNPNRIQVVMTGVAEK